MVTLAAMVTHCTNYIKDYAKHTVIGYHGFEHISHTYLTHAQRLKDFNFL